MDWLKDYQKLSLNHIYSIDKIEWWLLKYYKFQKDTYRNFYSEHKHVLEDGSIGRFPPCGPITKEEKFLNLYKALDTISQFHKNEKYFEKQMGLYHNIKYFKPDVFDWAAKNEDLGANQYACFLLDYLDYDEDEKVNHLNIFVLSAKELEIFVDRSDFRFTIEFLETFNELYWVQKIAR